MRLRFLFVACLLVCLPLARAQALLMQISNISDFTVTSWSITDPAIQMSMDICIYGLNIPSLTTYAITASSNPANFRISTGSGSIPYSLYWNDGGAGNLTSSIGTQMTDNVKLTLRSNLNILLANCGSQPTARLTMRITQADMIAALAGTYTGTVTLLLTPN